MMYQEKFAVAIKVDGKVLRETKDLVHLPFGSEFSVLVKNLNSRRAKFRLHIDGTDVLDGTEIIVNANSEVEMKRFIRNGNMNEGNAFKFIERTQSIEDGPRGIKVDDGIVRVEFWFEKEEPRIVDTIYRDRREYWWDTYYYPRGSTIVSGVKMKGTLRSHDVQYSTLSASTNSGTSENLANQVNQTSTESFNDIGITVPGSKVEQKFQSVYGFNSENQSHVIVLRLAGKTQKDEEVSKPITVKAKQKCVTCRKVNKATSRFCSGCGTALELL
jgi:hypothetical protein